MMNKSNESPIEDEPLTADKVDFETLIRRFSNATFDCDTIRKHVSECKAYVTACRVTADAPDAHKYNLALLATAMQTHGFTPPDAADLDAVDAYLDNIDRGAGKVMFDEQQALNAVMQLPFVLRMLGGVPDGMKDEMGKSIDAASKELAAADQLQREIIVCRHVCDMERIAERWAVKKGNGQGNDTEQFTAMMEQFTNLTHGQAAIYGAIGITKQQERTRQSGYDKTIRELRQKIAALKAENAAPTHG